MEKRSPYENTDFYSGYEESTEGYVSEREKVKMEPLKYDVCSPKEKGIHIDRLDDHSDYNMSGSYIVVCGSYFYQSGYQSNFYECISVYEYIAGGCVFGDSRA